MGCSLTSAGKANSYRRSGKIGSGNGSHDHDSASWSYGLVSVTPSSNQICKDEAALLQAMLGHPVPAFWEKIMIILQ
jgi:hypothetical protein